MNTTIRHLIKIPSGNEEFTILLVIITPCIEYRSEIGKYLGRDLAKKIKTIEIRKKKRLLAVKFNDRKFMGAARG